MDILSLLIDKGVITEADAAAFREEAAREGLPIEEILKRHEVPKETVLAVRGEYLQMPTRVIPEGYVVPSEVLSLIPEESARHYGIVPLAFADGVLEVGMTDPDNIEAVDALNFIASQKGMTYKIFLIAQEDFDRVLAMYGGIGGAINKALTALNEGGDEEQKPVVHLGGRSARPQESLTAPATPQGVPEARIESEDAPVTKIVATIIRNAVDGNASDIHIENNGEKVRVRFRVDGVLHTSILLPTKVHRAIVSRVKILASLKLDERRKPQDGRFSATIDGRKIDFRVSTFPTRFGEKVVLRILDPEKGITRLEELGMGEAHIKTVRTAIQKPYGMVLITGPTGSGKSTTLYAMLSEMDTERKNVVSLEDPVEYNIAGVSQSQVRPDIGYTFANGLRSILRQDPDVIMVGEIRDKETAQLAVQSALTGHLVLSTLHTNTAIGAIPRLRNMGVDPYLIAPTLELVIGQRLVRRLYPGSGRKIPLEGTLKKMLDEQFADLPEEYKKDIPLDQGYIWGLQPTGDCPTGTRGRTAVHEVLAVTREFEDAILNDAGENELYDLARSKGYLTMRESAIVKALKGEIPLEEVNTLGGSFAALAEEEAVQNPAQPPEEIAV